ncbi:MAG: hypothetical protein WC750_06095 [Patescibacteria group bacterium]|jgi:hypothetical protein
MSFFIDFFYGKKISQMSKQQEVLMAQVTDLTAAVARLQEASDAQFIALKANAITPEQLDVPVSAINEVANKLLQAIQ